VALVSYLQRLRDLADADPGRPAVTCGVESLSRAGLLRAIDQLALDLRARGLHEGDMLTIALPNSVDWFVAFGAAWRLGATPQPVSARLPRRELEAVIELADPPVILGLPGSSVPGRACLPAGYRPPQRTGELPEVVSRAWKAPTSGGSTGRPKLIVSASPAQLVQEYDAMRLGSTTLPGSTTPATTASGFSLGRKPAAAGGGIVRRKPCLFASRNTGDRLMSPAAARRWWAPCGMPRR